MIYLPDYVAKAYYAEIPGSSQFADGELQITHRRDGVLIKPKRVRNVVNTLLYQGRP